MHHYRYSHMSMVVLRFQHYKTEKNMYMRIYSYGMHSNIYIYTFITIYSLHKSKCSCFCGAQGSGSHVIRGTLNAEIPSATYISIRTVNWDCEIVRAAKWSRHISIWKAGDREIIGTVSGLGEWPPTTIPARVMMTSSKGNIFRITGHLCGEFTCHRQNSPHKGQWLGAFMLSLICVWINCWVNNREAGDLRRYRAHYDVIVML